MRAVTLAIGTSAMLYILLDLLMDVRGANDFIRPFHVVGLIAAVVISGIVTSSIYRYWPLRNLLNRCLAALLYVHVVLGFWAVALPVGDYVAIHKEQQMVNDESGLSAVSEMGYGWFYWDDSGMGNVPMSILDFIQPSLFCLIWMLPFLTFVLCTFLQTRPIKKQAQQDAAGNPLPAE